MGSAKLKGKNHPVNFCLLNLMGESCPYKSLVVVRFNQKAPKMLGSKHGEWKFTEKFPHEVCEEYILLPFSVLV
jgi:hypothetical protein